MIYDTHVTELDEFPDGIIVNKRNDGEGFAKYVRERTCHRKIFEDTNSFWDWEYAEVVEYEGCSECEAPLPATANYCYICGARVIEVEC